MKARAPSLELVEIDGVGHAPMLDEPQSKSEILEFLGRLD